MLLINRLTEPGSIKRIELRLDTVRVVLADGRERLYEVLPAFREWYTEQSDFGCLDAVADIRGD